MTSVEVPLDRARAGDLPAVCVMTGEPADGRVPLALDRTWRRWRSTTVRVPMSRPSFRRWLRRHRAMMWTRYAAIGLVVVALAFSPKSPPLALLALIGGGVVMAASVRTERSLAALQPRLERRRSVLTLHDVHEDFARALGSPSPESG